MKNIANINYFKDIYTVDKFNKHLNQKTENELPTTIDEGEPVNA